MKKHWIFLLFLLVGCKPLVQEANVKSDQDEPVLTGKVAKFNSEKGLLEFEGNASFKTSIAEAKGADKIVYNHTTKELVVYGYKDFSLYNGKIIHKNFMKKDTTGKSILKYTVGENIAYIDY